MYEDKHSRENRERERGFIQKKPERERNESNDCQTKLMEL